MPCRAASVEGNGMLKPTMFSGPSTYRRLLGVAVALALPCGLAVSGGSLANAAGSAASSPVAPALNGSAAGGRVIVVMKDQQNGLNLQTQARQWVTSAHDEQAPIVSSIESSGGSGVTQLAAPDAIAANVSAAEVAQLRSNPAVAEIVPDQMIQMGQVHTESAPPATATVVGNRGAGQGGDSGQPASIPPLATHVIPKNCPSTPVQEPEAVADIQASDGNPHAPDEANSIATGKGVIIANQGMNAMAGDPDLTRADGSHVIIDAPDYTADAGNDETFEDAASIGAQGLIDYQYSKSLPFSNVPPNCTFYIKGDAPDASLVDLTQIDTPILALSQVVAGIDNAVTTVHADVISESFGSTSLPTSTSGKLLAAADEAAVAAGVTVVESSGDSGPQGTVITAADDPSVIAAGGVDNFHIVALNDGYHSYQSNQMAAQSSGATSPTGKVVDLVASDWFGGETDCAPLINGCPSNYPIEAAAGTSEASPLIAGAAADVIQAYRQTHNGASPTPAMIKDILTSTATSIDAPADEQGAGLLNVYAAVKAAQQMPGTSYHGPDNAPSIISSPTQLDITGNGGSVSSQSISLYNASTHPTTVTAGYQWLGPERLIGKVVTEDVTAPDPSLPVPVAGASAAQPISFSVPPGLDRLQADMIWPDPSNSSVLMFDLFNPQGALVQQSYDDGTPGRTGRSPNIQHVEVNDPAPGRWTAVFLWGGDDDYVELAPAPPGSYRGSMSFKVSGQNYLTSRDAIRPVTIPAHSAVSVPVHVVMPVQPGDHPESLQLSASNGAAISMPIARRTLIPAAGGSFQTLIIGTSARSVGQISTYEIDVPAGQPDLNVSLHTADASPDNIFTYYLVNPSGTVVATASTPQTVNGQAVGDAGLTTADPVAGVWQIDVVLRLTVSGTEFTQTVYGNVSG
jgi:Subtilase family